MRFEEGMNRGQKVEGRTQKKEEERREEKRKEEGKAKGSGKLELAVGYYCWV